MVLHIWGHKAPGTIILEVDDQLIVDINIIIIFQQISIEGQLKCIMIKVAIHHGIRSPTGTHFITI